MKKKNYIGIIGLLLVLLLSCENIVKGNGDQNISFSMNEQCSSMIQRNLEENKNYTENSLLKIEYGLLRGEKALSSVTKNITVKELYTTVFDISEIPYGNNYFIYINIFFDDILIYNAFSDRLIVAPNNSELSINLSLEQHNSSVEYILNGGEFSQNQKGPSSYFINSNTVLPIPSKEGYLFDGWFINKDLSGNEITSIGKDFFKGDIVLYAKWNEDTPSFTAFNIPTVKKIKKGQSITATVTGSNFKIDGLLPEDFKLTCTEQSILTNSKVEIVDDTTLNVRLTVPETAGSYTVNIAYGKKKFDGKLKVDDVAVGDIILNDGTYVPYANITEEQKAKAIAIAFDANADGKILGLGLKESGKLSWAKKDTTGNNTSFTDIICIPPGAGAAHTATFTGDTDGSDNWNVICTKDTEGVKDAVNNYPAFDWVNNYGKTYTLPEVYQTGWYIPSISELVQIGKNETVLNQALEAVSGTALGTICYWSSSQHNLHSICAWTLGGNRFYNKSSSFYVRSIRAF